MSNYCLWTLTLASTLSAILMLATLTGPPGSALTFSQMLFISMHSLPSFIEFSKSTIFPRLKARQVPITQWALQVIVATTGSLLNNWAFAYNVPLTILIVFRSAGKPLSLSLSLNPICIENLSLQAFLFLCYLAISSWRNDIACAKLWVLNDISIIYL